ncbi:hypothetical protein M0R45_009110 [Rubus argutus]|uniref:Uncharacterized protein n=1 Tax=Rubus argutus TaxID=59490 RepID=A0AAW1Y3I8_RUBAR
MKRHGLGVAVADLERRIWLLVKDLTTFRIQRFTYPLFCSFGVNLSPKLKLVTVVKVEVRLITSEIRKIEVKVRDCVVVTELAKFVVASCK